MNAKEPMSTPELKPCPKEHNCPIGLDASPQFCSAGTCYRCLIERFRGISDGLALSEAGAAAMRQWANDTETQLGRMEREHECGPNCPCCELLHSIGPIPPTTAGEALLARLMAAEKERDDYKFRYDLRKATIDLYIEMTKKAGDVVGLDTEKADPPEWLAAIQNVVTERDTALAKVKELEGQSAWRPIESAPKDGTPILACLPPYIPAMVQWFGGKWSIDPSEFAKEEHFEEAFRSSIYEPTHWQPLPPPPAAAGSQNQPTTNTQNT